jgi:hypothetical protein
MTAHYEIDELDRQGVVVCPTAQEARALARVSDRLGVEWRPDGSARVFSRGQVGSVSLSSSTVVRRRQQTKLATRERPHASDGDGQVAHVTYLRRLSVTTKVPIANVLRLVSLAYQTLPIRGPVGHALLESESSSLDWLALLVVTEIEALVGQGVRRDYVLDDDELPYIRGRLRFDRSSVAVRPGLVPCEFVDLLVDVAENRVLKASLTLLMTQRLLPSLQGRVEQLLRTLGSVTLVRPSERLLDSCHLTRLNHHYRPALELCRLLMHQAGILLEPGGTAAPAYFFPMELVFQESVTTFLRKRLPTVRRQSSQMLDPARSPSR